MRKNIKNKSVWGKLKSRLWESDIEYYKKSEESLRKDFNNHPGLRQIEKYSLESDKVLDCGCGDGTLLELIWRKDRLFFGVDVSKLAIKLATKRLKEKPNITLRVANLESLPFRNSLFDLTYTAFVLEHLENPEKAVEEMVRVTKKGGVLIFLSPNFGCPHWSSPSIPFSLGFLLKRSLRLFLRSYWQLLFNPHSLQWEKVYPLVLKQKKWRSDWDTVCEPYLGTLLTFLSRRNIKVLTHSSGWLWEGEDLTPHQGVPGLVFSKLRKGFKVLGVRGISPYCFYGPTLFVVGKRI